MLLLVPQAAGRMIKRKKSEMYLNNLVTGISDTSHPRHIPIFKNMNIAESIMKGCLGVKQKEPQYVVVVGKHLVSAKLEFSCLPDASTF